MALYKRGKIWWIRFTAPNGERMRKSTGTENKTLDEEYHDTLKREYWRIHQLKERPRRKWEDAVVKWLHEHNHKKMHKQDIARLRWIDPFSSRALLG